MEVGPVFQWIAFLVFSLIAVAGAIGMTTTMSMFRSGIFLMSSFIGVAGLFILLLADLLALLQVMMYIGGMLVMILFMLLFSNDPGGSMMSSHMSLEGFEKFFSLGLAHMKQGSGGDEGHGEHEQHAGADGKSGDEHGEEHGNHGDNDAQEHEHSGGGGHSDMSMFTSAKQPAAWLALAVGVALVTLLVWRPHWAIAEAMPDQDSPRRIGHMLMDKYMIAFEGAALLILLGIFGAVFVQRPGQHPDPADRNRLRAAVDETPAPIDPDPLTPLAVDLRRLLVIDNREDTGR